ncbi:MAG: DNA internalization-related competence protein ComEC/Rec2 [Chromatiaceae bacterium]|nr:DNA internalization-related competence protein ComEC/Rec2 [Chromatiaceae bacterium]
MTHPERHNGCRPPPDALPTEWASPIFAALGFALGACLFFTWSEPPPAWPLGLLAAAMAYLAWHWAPARPVFWLLLGLLWAQFRACDLLCHPFPAELARADLRLEGRVASLPESKSGGTRFQFRVERAWQGERELGFAGLVRLTWRGAPPLRVGEGRALGVRLKPPHGFANPGGFDYERWLFQQGIVATGYVREGGDLGLIDAGAGPYWIDRWRQGLSERLGRVLGGSPAVGLVLALVLGEDAEVTPAQWEALTRTGVNHLVSISGLHVGLVAASLFFLTRWSWSRSPWLVARLAAPRAGALGGLVAALIYSALAGFAVCTQRSLIMLSVVLVALLWSRTPRPWTGLTFALAAVLLLDPTEALSYGLWLSFGGVAALIYGLGNRLALEGLWRRWGQAQWVATLGFLPLLLLLFSRASVVSPLVNLVAIPLFGLLLPLVLIAAALLLMTGIATPLVWTTALLAWLLDGLTTISAWPWASVGVAARPDWAWVAAFGGALLLLAPRGLPGRWLGLPLLLPLGLLTPPAPATGEAWLRLLDVGQGLSAVIRTAHHVLVLDTGPAFLGGFNTGEVVVVPYLREQGVRRIDTLVLSHGDQDHVGGFAGLAAQMPIDRILAGEPGKLADPRAEPCLAGQGWTWDGVDFAVLYPPQAGLEGNDSACVLRVATQGASLLVPGDLGQAPERQLARRGGLTTTLLVAGHHGSNTSSSREFLAAVTPAWVLYASGFANRFGFPSARVRERVAAVGARELNTAEAGAIGFVLTTAGLDGPDLYREAHPRLWSWRPPGER